MTKYVSALMVIAAMCLVSFASAEPPKQPVPDLAQQVADLNRRVTKLERQFAATKAKPVPERRPQKW